MRFAHLHFNAFTSDGYQAGMQKYPIATTALVATVLVAAALLGWIFYPSRPDIRGDRQYQPRSQLHIPGGFDCRPENIEIMQEDGNFTKQYECLEAEEQYRLTSNELLQQRRAADAAEASSLLSYQQTILAMMGLISGFVTMAAAIAAAHFTWKAAVAARTSADSAASSLEHMERALVKATEANNAANEANQIARDGHISDTRAWIIVKDLHIFELSFERDWVDVLFKAKIENVGKSPASRYSFYEKLFNLDDNNFDKQYTELTQDLDRNRKANDLNALAPGETHEIKKGRRFYYKELSAPDAPYPLKLYLGVMYDSMPSIHGNVTIKYLSLFLRRSNRGFSFDPTKVSKFNNIGFGLDKHITT